MVNATDDKALTNPKQVMCLIVALTLSGRKKLYLRLACILRFFEITKIMWANRLI